MPFRGLPLRHLPNLLAVVPCPKTIALDIIALIPTQADAGQGQLVRCLGFLSIALNLGGSVLQLTELFCATDHVGRLVLGGYPDVLLKAAE